MAYMSQEHKKRIAKELKKVLPKDWRYTLAVKHHSSIVLNIWEGPAEIMINGKGETAQKQYSPNEYYLAEAFQDERIGQFFIEVKKALDLDNFDNSDPTTDYFHVGHYVDINFGRWDKAYIVNEKASKPWESEPAATEKADPVYVESIEDFVNSIPTSDPDPVVKAEPKKQAKTAVKKQQRTVKTILKSAAVEILTIWLAKLQS